MSAHARTVDLGVGESGLAEGCRGCGGGEGCGGDCGCGGHVCATCGGAGERPRWFTGQLVGPSDLEALQQWVIGRNRRHNRMLHGWGVVCGLAVTPTLDQQGRAQPWSVTVGEGYALSGCGDEVCLPGAVQIDIRQPRPDGVDGCAPPVDPWCAPVRQRRDPQRTYYLAVRYAEEQRRPVRAACDCGCDDDPCEYSRVGETYTLAVLEELPDCYADRRDSRDQREWTSTGTDDEEGREEAVRCSARMRRLGTRPCPTCCSPWVVLADLRVDTAGQVQVDSLAHRRFVASFGSYGFTCRTEEEYRRLSVAEREVVRSSFRESALEEVDDDDPGTVLSAHATALRGAGVSEAMRAVIGDRTVSELATTDMSALTRRAEALGVDVDDVERVHARAQLLFRLIQE